MKKALKDNIMLLILVALIIACFFAWWHAINEVKEYFNERNRFESAIEEPLKYNGFSSWNEHGHYKRLHKFHGTLSSERDCDGTDWFERDGKRCSLWDPKVRTDQ
jgi:hypothetical protein